MLADSATDTAVPYSVRSHCSLKTLATPSYTWPGLKGRWPLLFNVLTSIYGDIKGGFCAYSNAASDGVHCYHSYETPSFLIPADVYEKYPESTAEGAGVLEPA